MMCTLLFISLLVYVKTVRYIYLSFDAILLFQQFNGINGFINYNYRTKERYQNNFFCTCIYFNKNKSQFTHTQQNRNEYIR